LNQELFTSPEESRFIVEQYRVDHHETRPHSSLDYRTPLEFAAQQRIPVSIPSAPVGATAFDSPEVEEEENNIDLMTVLS
jgi:hypothetical protein